MTNPPRPRTLKHRFALFFKGAAMGAADVVPGVSGGTVAFITGIYEELVDSLSAIDLAALKLLFQGKPGEAWQHINGTFLLLVFGGILLSILSLAKLISWVLLHHPKMIWGYFLGLIIASVVYIGRGVAPNCWRNWLAFVLGTMLAYWITAMSQIQLVPMPLTIFIAGAVAICAMVLPGISGSFILLILGMYHPIIDALKDLNGTVLIVFLLGCITGLISFTHLLSWLLHHYRQLMLALLTGFMLGSLNKVWPWKISQAPGDDTPTRNLLPGNYQTLTQNDPQLGLVVMMVLIGLLTVYLINHAGNNASD